jgi:biotin operon repressor
MPGAHPRRRRRVELSDEVLDRLARIVGPESRVLPSFLRSLRGFRTKEELSREVGISPQMVKYLLGKLRKFGLLRVNGRRYYSLEPTAVSNVVKGWEDGGG